MSLFRKLVILLALSILVVLSATLALVYSESRQTIIGLSREKAISIIQTVDSALESNVPDYQFETVLLHLKTKDQNLESFDIYKMNGYLIDIASTNPRMIGTQAANSSVEALNTNRTVTSAQGSTLEITAPIYGYQNVRYTASVKYSIADDLKSAQRLLDAVLWVGLCALVLSVFAVWIFTREFLSKPVLEVVSAANHVAVGNFLQVDLTSARGRHDEIGSLARSFEAMTRSLQKMISQLADTSDKLNTEFDELVTHGDYSAQGAMHAVDVVHHVAKSAQSQATSLQALTQTMGDSLKQSQSVRPSASVAQSLLDASASWLSSIETAASRLRDMKRDLDSISSTVNGLLGSVQEVNLTAARLGQMAKDLRNLISTFDI